ncbi:MAG: cytochrome c peroxidase [Gaiellales bacterium]
MKRSGWLSGCLAAAVLIAGVGARAHGPDGHAEPAAETRVSRKGRAAAGFETPAPGSYTLPPLRRAADGAVVASDGSATTLYDTFGDRTVLLSFIYTRCGQAEGCPLATASLRRVGHRLRGEPELNRRLRLVSLSFDPRRDTPEVMARYGESFAGGEVDWQFLTTTSQQQLQPILESYDQTLVTASGGSGGISHVLRVFLIDPDRRIRNVYSTSFLDPEALVSDVQTVLLEIDGHAAAALAGASVAGRTGPGDDRRGYEHDDYRTRSVGIASRRGAPADLFGRAHTTQLGLPALPEPRDNRLTAEKIALGRKLFFDRRLSQNGTLSCAMCHIPEQGFASNELATAVGIEGRTVRRNAPTLFNVAYLPNLFHDGRETRLEHQVWGPLLAANEMGNPSIGAVLATIRDAGDYDGFFERAFPKRGLAQETVGMALASYQRALVAGASPFDRWNFGGEARAASEAVRRGFELFRGAAACVACHTVGDENALFTDGRFHNTGVGYAASMGRDSALQRVQVAPGRYLIVDRAIVAQVSEAPPSDLGRYEITRDPADRWKYRTPTLRNIALTAPYMHDGSLATLRGVVDFYDRGGVPNEGRDPLLRPLGLRERDALHLVAFLESLTGGDIETLVADAFAAPIGDVP